MSEIYYLDKIRYLQGQIYDVEDEIRRKTKELEDLQLFEAEHSRTVQEMGEYFYRKKQRVNQLSLDGNRVKSFAKYQHGVLDFLNGNENRKHFDRKYDEQVEISRVIKEVEDELRRLKRQIGQYEDKISDYKYQMRMEMV